MAKQHGELREQPEEHNGDSLIPVHKKPYLRYYRNGIEGTGEMKVKWVVRVVSGDEARRVDQRQAKAIRELLQWAQRHHKL